jgi:hypothetical protein
MSKKKTQVHMPTAGAAGANSSSSRDEDDIDESVKLLTERSTLA